jgi:butyrate kinase
MYKILVINPGSTSTKVGLFEDHEPLFMETQRHSVEETSPDLDRREQARFRREAILRLLAEKQFPLSGLAAIVARGGLLKPLASGTYLVDEELCADLLSAKYGWHASNLGNLIALPLARQLDLPAYTVDPVTVDEFETPARYSGLKGLPRLSMSHALNMKAVARLAAARMGKVYEELNIIVTHLGSGISVSAHRAGKMIDVNNANEEGPFSLERCGTLPALGLVRLCYNGEHSREEMVNLLTSRGGIYSYLGTKDFKAVEESAAAGDEQAREVTAAMAYQVAKEIGAMAAVLEGAVDSVVITGGMANAALLVKLIAKKVDFIAPLIVIPGEAELEALAAGALRVLRGEIAALPYRA